MYRFKGYCLSDNALFLFKNPSGLFLKVTFALILEKKYFYFF